MGSTTAPASLAAIKGLDSTPDVSWQLQRAIELCDHPARAEMILKWVAEKCNKDPEVKSNIALWSLLSHTTRLLKVEKLAASLAPINPINIISLALVDATGSPETLTQIASFCELLHQVSNAPGRDAVRAIFVADAETASRFLGSCLSGAMEYLSNRELTPEDIAIVASLVRFAALVWALRKSTPEDDMVFSTHCLIPAARLHSKLSPALSGSTPPGKRSQRGDDLLSSPGTTVAALIARHVFIPARSAFSRFALGESDSAVLDRRLEHLGEVNADVCSALFDVCCRSVSLTTQRSKLRERPWVEAVFNTLLAKCSEDHELLCVQQLLAIVEQRATMTTDRLVRISGDYAFSADHEVAEWDLIAQIIRLDGDVYVEESRATRLFEKISSSFQDSNDPAGRAGFVADKILTPVMQVFARHRNLATFIEMWSQRLQSSSSSRLDFDWAHLAAAFSKLVNTALSATKVTELVSFNCEAVHRAAEDGKEAISNEESKPTLAASVVVLHGLIDGTRDEQVLDSVSPTLQTLFTDLLGLVSHIPEQEWVENKYMQYIWPTLNKSLAIWFPRWSYQQDQDSIAQQMRSMVGSKGFRAAKKLAKSQPDNGPLSRFLAAVLVYAPGEATQSKDAEAISKLAVKGAKAAEEAFIVEPKLFGLCPDVLSATISTELGGTRVGEQHDSNLAAPLVSAATSQSPAEATETVLEAVCAAAEASTKNSTAGTAERVLLSLRLLAEVSPQLAAAKRRRTVVARLLKIDVPKDADDPKLSEEIQHRRLAALIQWVPLTNIDLETSPQERSGMFWKLAEHQPPRNSQHQYLKLLQAALGAISGRIYAAEAKSSEKGLQVEMVQKLESSLRKQNKTTPLDLSLAIAIRVAVSDLEKYKSPGQHSVDPSTTAQYVKHLLEVVQRGLDSDFALLTSMVLDSLLQLPKATLEDCDTEIQALQRQCRHYVSQLFNVEQLPPSGPALEAHVTGFKMACVWSLYAKSSTALVDLGTKLLQGQPQPDQLMSILSHFREYVRKEVGFSARVDLAHLLLERGSEGVRLAHETIATLQKTEVDELGHVPQQRILHSLAKLAADPSKQEISRQALACVATILREKHFLVNQYSLESTLHALMSIMRDPSARQAHIIAAHRVFVVVLQQHRARVQDRLNLVVCVLQMSLTQVFKPSPTTKEQGAVSAQMLARILQLLCDPPASRASTHTSDLVDEARKTRAAAGRHVQNVLHHYCGLVLASPNAEVTESLRPGIWAMIAAMEVNSEDAVKVLSAAMNNSERAVLRGVYEEYQRSAKWKGG